jgi:hypothetical protein
MFRVRTTDWISLLPDVFLTAIIFDTLQYDEVIYGRSWGGFITSSLTARFVYHFMGGFKKSSVFLYGV